MQSNSFDVYCGEKLRHSMSSLREQLHTPKLCKVKSVARPSKWVLSNILLENRKHLLVILQHLARCCRLCYLFLLSMRTVCFLTQLLVRHFFFLMSAFSFFSESESRKLGGKQPAGLQIQPCREDGSA